MDLVFLKSKLHKACVTHAEVEYEGSCAIDSQLLEMAHIAEYEQIQIYNVNNGERLTTYAIAAQAGSRIISVNGAAARKANPNDRLIICSYCSLSAEEAKNHKPILIYLDEENKVTGFARDIPVQLVSE